MSGLVLRLDGKVVLVTGGSRGIGAATVRMFREAGARVVFSYEKAGERAEALAAEMGGGDFCRAVRQDLRTPEDGGRLVAAAVAAWGRLDCLVVNHGIWPAHEQPIATMTDSQWRATMGVNLDSVFGLVRAGVGVMLGQGALVDSIGGPTHRGEAAMNGARDGEEQPHVLEARHGAPGVEVGRGEHSTLSDTTGKDGAPAAKTGQGEQAVRGHIVLIASTAAQRGEAFHADYAASKGALVSLTKSLSSELGPQGILCNCVAPGWVGTEMSLAALSDPETSKKALAPIPLGRVGHVDEIAGPVVFLCTPLAGFISGEVFNVNGGAVLVG